MRRTTVEHPRPEAREEQVANELARDRWSVYDYFTLTRELDRARYPATAALRALLAAAGFVECRTDGSIP